MIPINSRKPVLTDQAVDALPLHHGRADLLEEIMSTPVVDRPVVRTSERHRSRHLAPLAAAAVVAALAGATLWWVPGSPSDDGFTAAPDSTTQEEPVYLPLLEAPGWVLTGAGPAYDGGGVQYSRGDADLEIGWREAGLYDDYVEDRENIVDPPAPGRPVEVIGRSGQLWSYSDEDHTTISVVEDDLYYELRGGGLRRPAYLDLLAQVRLVALTEFESAMPADFITADERSATSSEMVAGIVEALAPRHGLVPSGSPSLSLDTQAMVRYDLGTDVAGSIACVWLDHYVKGRSAGDAVAMEEAVDAMSTARDWPILQELAAEGDYPEVIWELADQIAAGGNPRGFENGLGCP